MSKYNLNESGVSIMGQNETEQLKPKQMAMIECLCDYSDLLNIQEKCRKMSVPRTTFYRWMKDSVFLQAYQERREHVLKSVAGHIDRAMVNGALKEKPELIKLFYQRIGELRREEKEAIRIEFAYKIPEPVGMREDTIIGESVLAVANENQLVETIKPEEVKELPNSQ